MTITRSIRRTRAALVAAALLPAGLLAACSTSTSGSGTVTRPSPTASTARTGTTAAPTPTSAPSTTSSTRRSTAPATSAAPSGVIQAPASPLRTVTTTDPDDVHHVVKVWAERRDTTCYDHAYGQPVITFLTAHPCRGMDRILATTSTTAGRAVGFSLVSTSFDGTPDDPYKDTSAFRALVVKDGTGSIDDLLREGYRLPSGPTSVPSPDAFDCLGQDNGVAIYDLWYLDGPTPENDPALEKLAEQIFLQV